MNSIPASHPRKSSVSQAYILALLFIGVLMGALDISIVGPAIPAIEESMQVSERDMTWIFSIYILFNLIGISLMARLSDRFGRRLLYMISVGIFGAGSLVVSFAGDIELLLTGRAIQGFGSSGIFPVAVAVIGDIFPMEKRGRALGLIGAVFGLAFLMGPFIAGILLRYYEWNALFLINIPLAIVILVLSWYLLPAKPAEDPPAIDWSGIVLLSLILGAYTLGTNLIDAGNIERSLGSFPVLPLLLLAGILTPILFMLESRQKEPVFNTRLFKNQQILIVGVIAIGLGLFQSSVVFLPSLAVILFKVSPSDASFMLLPVVAASVAGSPAGGRLIDKFGSRVIILTGMVLTTLGLILFGMMIPGRGWFYLSGALLGFGLTMRAALNYVILNETSSRERASAQGVLLIFISIGQLTGAALLGILTAAPEGALEGYRWTFVAMSGLAILLLILSGFLKTRAGEKK